MRTIKKTSTRGMVLAIIIASLIGGVAFAIDQITREVSASVNVQLLPDSGIEIYLDAELTQIADSVDFGVMELDVFGTVKEAASVPVWVENKSLSRIKVTLRDDFAPADVLFVGPNQQQFLDPGEVLAAHSYRPYTGSSILNRSHFPSRIGPGRVSMGQCSNRLAFR